MTTSFLKTSFYFHHFVGHIARICLNIMHQLWKFKWKTIGSLPLRFNVSLWQGQWMWCFRPHITPRGTSGPKRFQYPFGFSSVHYLALCMPHPLKRGRGTETVLFQDSPINQSGIRISFLRQCQVTDEKKKGGGDFIL